jgi:menaquinone-9 beta-reductase
VVKRQPTADVAVVGAGPAGSAAAIILSRLGRQVVLIDKAAFPRDKCCGDGLTTAALRRLQKLGLDPAAVKSWAPVKGAEVVATDGYCLNLPLPGGGQFAASARRADLDSELVDLARRAGADVIEGCAVTTVAEADGGEGVSIELDDGSRLLARYVIACDGAWSSVRKALGLGDAGYLGDWQAGRQYFERVGPQARRLWVWFEADLVPGYAWSFPLADGTANVGYGVIRPPGQRLGDLRGQRIDFLARPHIAAVLGSQARAASPWKAWPIPARIGSTPVSGLGGRVLFAGDAARGCDPMTGEGIAQAFETAELAARAIAIAGPHRPAAAAARYERQIRWGLAVDDHLSRSLSRVLARPRGSAQSLRLAGGSTWCRRIFARWMFEDFPRAAFATPHRWQRRMFTRPGAYRPSGPG